MTNTPDLDDPEFYLNRELSELAFQRRVLHEAIDDRHPLLERVKFLSLFTKNMDEFFRKRVGGLREQIEAGLTERTVDGLTPEEQWEAIIKASGPMFEQQAQAYQELHDVLAEEGVLIDSYHDLSKDEQTELREYFKQSVMPTLTPLTFDPTHPFPHISNLSLSLGVLTRDGPDGQLVFSRVKVPGNRPRLVRVGEETRYVLMEDIIGENLDLLFPNVEVVSYSTFRVTRNAEVRRNEELAEDLVQRIEEMIRDRRFAGVVRLEIEDEAHPEVRELLIEQLDLDEAEVFDLPGPLDYRDFMSLFELDRPDLKREPWEPRDHPRLPRSADVDIFEEIRRKDMLVHHPYHSFEGTVQQFFDEAAHDPDVLAIKAAIYRTAEDSAVVESLIQAARNGKQVGVMVELKARFDEENNLRWVERLEEEGIHVAYGKLGYKAHTKTSLVVREEDDGVTLYSHVGTGNYHSETAKQYEDLGLLTADRAVGQDLVKLFNYFTGHSLPTDYESLVFAPTNMRQRFVDLIQREIEHANAGKSAQIVAKVNRLEDAALTRELYEASQAGVDVDLIVRDICRLRPGLDGISETISVRSIVGRFLEHSRVWQFHNDGDPEYFIGSADWMHRNLDDRVEAVVPISDPDLQSYLDELLETLLADNRRAWEMQPDGTYVQLMPGDDRTIDTHERLMRRAIESEPERQSDPVAVDLEAPLAPDSEAVSEPVHLPDSFVEPALDEVIRSLDVDSEHGLSAWRESDGEPPEGDSGEHSTDEADASATTADSGSAKNGSSAADEADEPAASRTAEESVGPDPESSEGRE